MASTPASNETISVTLEVERDHPHLTLRDTLDWNAIEAALRYWWALAGKNVLGKRGRPFDLPFWARVIVLMLLLKLDSRQMERELKYNVVAREFVKVENPREGFARDHANIDRTYRALGVNGIEELNHLVIQVAEREGYVDRSILSSDTTVQETSVGYPNEPGIMRNVAMRTLLASKRILKAGLEGAEKLVEVVEQKAKEVFKKVKEYRLFAKDQSREVKDQLIEQMMGSTKELMEGAMQLRLLCSNVGKNRWVSSGCERLQQLQSFVCGLLPQIRYWLETKRVATNKLLHPGLPESRSHKRGKPGKKVEFGFKWLFNRLEGGYVFGRMFLGRPGDNQMPAHALAGYQQVFGQEALPKMFVYDRGAWSEANIQMLQAAGVEDIAIAPQGQADWCVGESEQEVAKSLRGQTEGLIGTVKCGGYGFNKPKERVLETVEMAGQRAFASKNLNKLMNDLQKEKTES